jgi:hypothetical protein
MLVFITHGERVFIQCSDVVMFCEPTQKALQNRCQQMWDKNSIGIYHIKKILEIIMCSKRRVDKY